LCDPVSTASRIWFRISATERGLIGYAPHLADQIARAASFVGRILRGAKPGDLPIEYPTRFELIVNLKTAKAIGVTIPESFLARADKVIERNGSRVRRSLYRSSAKPVQGSLAGGMSTVGGRGGRTGFAPVAGAGTIESLSKICCSTACNSVISRVICSRPAVTWAVS
jgi:ABC transporter substrate binding protein